MGEGSEEEMISSPLLHTEITMTICVLIPLILYKHYLLSLFRCVLLILLIIFIFVIAGEKIVEHAASIGRKICTRRKCICSCLAKKKRFPNLNGSGIEKPGYYIDRLFVSTKIIAKGSNGTVIFEGVYEGRKVAVKRMSKALRNEASEEVQHLVASDKHPNIVRWHGVKYDKDYVYLVLERCICSLSDLISLHVDPHSNSDCFFHQAIGSPSSATMQNINLWKNNGYPSTLLLKLMRDMVHGLVHLHKLGIIHQDIKPQNVMIAEGKDICAKLSDIGISKCLPSDKSPRSRNTTGSGSSGWEAPEHKFHKHQTWASDMYSLGCVFFFCLTRGIHPFDIDSCNNILSLQLLGNMPEATDLLSCLLQSNPVMRPSAFQVLHHPLFWDSDKRLSFLRDVSDRLKLERRKHGSNLLITLESVAKQVFGNRWDKKMELALIKDINRCSHYKYRSVQHLLRVVRNILNHYHESPRKIKELFGPTPEGLDNYFTCRFPRLLMEVYKVVVSNCRSEKCFEKYFEVDSVATV